MQLGTVEPTEAKWSAREARQPPNGLSEREREVVAYLVSGLTNRQIAQHLSITPITVKHHLSHIFCKLDVRSRLELALFALRHGLVSVPRSSALPRRTQR